MAPSNSRQRFVSAAQDDTRAVPRAGSLLQVWEQGREASPGEQGLFLLQITDPAMSEADRSALSVGQRDARLLALFRNLFGGTAAALATCPGCHEPLEFDVPLAEITVGIPARTPDRFAVIYGGREIAFRLPRAGDLAALGARRSDGPVGDAGRALVELCVLGVRAADGMSADFVLDGDAAAALEAAIAVRVAEVDPQAVVTLEFDCPSCAAHWRSPFDIVEFLWRRLDVFARALLRDVHVLAVNYGWSERAILALTPWRRRYYIELLGA
jgi:hypothetical protein